jgi:SNF2 family DNA or RNA helicase
MITTYDTYRIHSDLINTIRWDCVIADECHKIKERTSETTKTMNNINALCRIGLTGTAIQNKYEELWTLLNWTNPGTFGPLSNWKSTVAVPLKLGQSHDATYAQLKKSREVAQKLVNNLLPRFLLRRPKTLIADQLPKKSDKVVFCPLSDTQELAYNNFCDTEILQIIRHAYEPCDCGSGKKQGWCCYTHVEDGTRWQNFVFPALQTFQKIANHLTLLLPHSPDGGQAHEKELEKLKMAMPDAWEELYANRENIIYNTNPQFCGKWRILKKLLKLWHENGDKVLIFSYSVRLLNMLDMLFKMTTTYNVSSLSGKTPNDERQVSASHTIVQYVLIFRL